MPCCRTMKRANEGEFLPIGCNNGGAIFQKGGSQKQRALVKHECDMDWRPEVSDSQEGDIVVDTVAKII